MPVGTQIVDIPTLRDIDRMSSRSRASMEAIHGSGRGRRVTKNTPSAFILDYLRRKGFNGKLGNASVTRIFFNASDFDAAQRNVRLNDAFAIVSELPLSSSGRGTIGSLVVMSTIVPAYTDQVDYLIRQHKVLEGPDGLTAVDKLIADSTEAWSEAQREALRRTVSAGLPTLGKRR